MLVKDLIHLLQTRGKPDDEVWIAADFDAKDGHIHESMCQLEDEFYVVYTDDLHYENGAKESICKLGIGRNQFKQLMVGIKEAQQKDAKMD